MYVDWVSNTDNRQLTAGYVNWDSPGAGCDGTDYTAGVDTTAISGSPLPTVSPLGDVGTSVPS
jgi:hypothetical protein